jgi:hypothetical protein
MDERVPRLESEIRRLTQSLAAVERRVASLEAMLAGTAARSAIGAIPPIPTEATSDGKLPVGRASAAGAPVDLVPEDGIQAVLALAGRTLIVLGGAYLLRALTEARLFSAPVGVTLGLLYAGVWLAAAARARGEATAAWHAIAASLISLPIVWEATFRFGLLSPAGSAGTLGLFAAAALAIAAAKRYEPVAWIGVTGVTFCSIAVAVATGGFVSHAILIIALGVATLWLGYVFDWLALRWPIAAVATAMVAGVTIRGVAGLEPLAAFVVQVLFFGAYLGSFAVRTLFLGRAVIPFEVAQSIAVIAVGFGGAVYLSAGNGANVGALGLLALGFGTAGYGVAFAFVEKRRPARNFFFYAAVALTYMMVGAPLVLGQSGASILFAALGTVAAMAARRVPRVTLTWHCVAYLLAAAAASGLIVLSTSSLLQRSGVGWAGVGVAQALTLGAIAVSAWLLVPGAAGLQPGHRVPRAVLLATVVWTAAGAIVAILAAASPVVDAGWLAALRTVVLVAAVILLCQGRATATAERAWLVYALLAVAAVKLVMDDLPHGRPTTLMIGLAAYGAALVIVPRALRRSGEL